MVKVMKRLMTMMALAITVLGFQAAEAALTKEDLKEIRQLVREEVQVVEQHLSKRIDDTNKRIDDTNGRITSLAEDINARFAWNFTMLASIIALMGVMVGSVVWLARQDRPVTQRHYEQIMIREDRLEEKVRHLEKTLETLKPHKA